MIGEIEKGKLYVEEHGKCIHFQLFTVQVDGDISSHVVKLENGVVQCDCDFFRTHGCCSCTITLETVLEGMLQVHEVALRRNS